MVPVPETDLPVLLPEDAEFKPTGESPLKYHAGFVNTTCPRCGSSETYYNKQYGTWRCGKCEHSFVVEGLTDKTPWWKRLFAKKQS